MIDLSQSCIFCGSAEDLNTTMVVKVDGEKYKVAISEDCEDEAIPSKIKEIVLSKVDERASKLEQLKKIAEELGFGLVDPSALNSNSLVIPQANPPQPPQPPQPQPQQRTQREEGTPPADASNMPKVGNFRVQKNNRKTQANEGMSPKEVQAAHEQARRSSKGGRTDSPTSRQAPRFASHQIPNRVEAKDHRGNVVQVERPTNIAKKVQVVRGRAGVPISIPKSIVSSDGETIIETTINVVDTGGDRMLQNRTKQLSEMQSMGVVGDYSNQCRMCRGVGLIKKSACKDCGGTGFEI